MHYCHTVYSKLVQNFKVNCIVIKLLKLERKLWFSFWFLSLRGRWILAQALSYVVWFQPISIPRGTPGSYSRGLDVTTAKSRLLVSSFLSG